MVEIPSSVAIENKFVCNIDKGANDFFGITNAGDDAEFGKQETKSTPSSNSAPLKSKILF